MNVIQVSKGPEDKLFTQRGRVTVNKTRTYVSETRSPVVGR